MSPELSWFVVRLAVVGVPEDQAPEETLAIQDDLTARPHLRDPKVTWDGPTRRAIVQVEMEGTDSHSTADQMAEELLEVCSGVLLAPGPIHVDILGAKPAERS